MSIKTLIKGADEILNFFYSIKGCIMLAFFFYGGVMMSDFIGGNWLVAVEAFFGMGSILLLIKLIKEIIIN